MVNPETILNQGGLYTDDLSLNVRILSPNMQQLNCNLMSECREYIAASADCKKCCESLMKNLKNYAELVAEEKKKVLCLNNRIIHINANGAKDRSLLSELINDRKKILEGLTSQSKSLSQVEKDLEEKVKVLT